jgi:hypothetical protein
VIFTHDDLQAVIQREFGGGLWVGSRCGEGQTDCAEQQACGTAG